MATILLTWELGLATGHIAKLRPLAQALRGNGHRVVAALKDVSVAPQLAAASEFAIVQAPVRLNAVRNAIRLPSTFAHVLHNAGFGDANELRPHVAAWQALFDLVKPDLLIAEHSPTALLASMSRPMRRATIGTGFTCPPPITPLPDWRPYLRNDPVQLETDERQVLATINELLHAWDEPVLERVTELYARSDQTFLATFAELDHFGPRHGIEYWRTGFAAIGSEPRWPEGEGRRVFGYLKPFAALEAVLTWLRNHRVPTLIYGPQIDPAIRMRLAADTLRFADEPVNLAAAGRWCDVALLNATHGTTAEILLTGKPILQIPLFLEQQLTADNVDRLGAGLTSPANDPAVAIEQLQKLMTDSSYRQTAEQFRRRYAHFNPQVRLDRMMARVEELIPARDGVCQVV